jgi:hypothetical protein
MQMFVKRLDRDNTYISELEKEVVLFLTELENQVNQLNKQYGDTDG